MTDMNENVEIVQGGKKNIVLDSQVLTALMGCPRFADFRFNHSFLPISGKSNSLECGSLTHVFMEYYYRSIIKGVNKEEAKGFGFAAAETYVRGCKDCTDFIPSDEITKPICGHKINEFPGLKNTPKDNVKASEGISAKTGWQWVLDTCDQYCIFWKNDHWIPLEVETVHGVVLYEDEEIRVLWKAKLDLVADTNQGIYPIDHKTMKQNRKTCSMNNQFMGQCLIMKTRNVFINKIGFQATLSPAERFIRPPVSYSAARLFEWQSEILPFYAKLLLMYTEVGYFPPQFDHCEGKYGSCKFLSVCESNPDMREEELKRLFYIGPEWNPTNENDED